MEEVPGVIRAGGIKGVRYSVLFLGVNSGDSILISSDFVDIVGGGWVD